MADANPMRAMVLAAGLGSRLRPLSNNWPKCLMPMANRPLIQYTLERLAGLGVSRAVVNTHYLAYEVHAYLQNRKEPDISISHEHKLLGTGGALVKARRLLGDEPFWHMNADIWCNADLSLMPELMHASNAIAVLGLVDDPRYNSVAIDSRNQVLGIKGYCKVPEHAPLFTYSGLAFLHPRLLNYLPGKGVSNLVDAWQRALLAGESMIGLKLKSPWNDLGTWQALWQANYNLAQTMESPVMLDESVHLHASAQIQGFCFAGKGVSIAQNARLKNCVILPGAVIAAETVAENAIIGKDYHASGVLKDGAFA